MLEKYARFRPQLRTAPLKREILLDDERAEVVFPSSTEDGSIEAQASAGIPRTAPTFPSSTEDGSIEARMWHRATSARGTVSVLN